MYRNIPGNYLLVFYDIADTWSLSVFLSESKIQSLLHTKKALEDCILMMVLSAICVLILLATIHLEQMSFPVINLVAMFVFTVIDSLYVIAAVITCAYIFVVYKRQMKARKIFFNVKNTHDQFQLLVPALIVVTHIFFSFSWYLIVAHSDEFSKKLFENARNRTHFTCFRLACWPFNLRV